MDRLIMEEKYRRLYQEPETCEPLVQINFPVPLTYSVREQFHSKEKMLAQQILIAEAHERVGDDFIPALRVNFGTAQIAASFGYTSRSDGQKRQTRRFMPKNSGFAKHLAEWRHVTSSQTPRIRLLPTALIAV